MGLAAASFAACSSLDWVRRYYPDVELTLACQRENTDEQGVVVARSGPSPLVWYKHPRRCATYSRFRWRAAASCGISIAAVLQRELAGGGCCLLCQALIAEVGASLRAFLGLRTASLRGVEKRPYRPVQRQFTCVSAPGIFGGLHTAPSDAPSVWMEEMRRLLPFLPSPAEGLFAADLFCGAAGGWTWAMKLMGFAVKLGVDFDKLGLSAYARNHPDVEPVLLNLRFVLIAIEIIDSFGLLHLIGISSPCQGFSYGTSGSVAYDKRRELIVCAARIVAGLARPPDVVVIENVLGMMQPEPAQEWLDAKIILERVGYVFQDSTLDASRCGPPQARHRVFVVGVRGGRGCELLSICDSAARRAPTPVIDYSASRLFCFIPFGKGGDRKHVYDASRAMRCLRSPCASRPAQDRYAPAGRRDDGLLADTPVFHLEDFAVFQGLPPWTALPTARRRAMLAIANSVVPVCGALAIGAVNWCAMRQALEAEGHGRDALVEAARAEIGARSAQVWAALARTLIEEEDEPPRPQQQQAQFLAAAPRPPTSARHADALVGGQVEGGTGKHEAARKGRRVKDDDGGVRDHSGAMPQVKSGKESALPTTLAASAGLRASAEPHGGTCRRCAKTQWIPATLAFRALGVQVGGITHCVRVPEAYCWEQLDQRTYATLCEEGRPEGGRTGRLRATDW